MTNNALLIERAAHPIPDRVQPVKRFIARRFIEVYHYLGDLPNIEVCRHTLGVFSTGDLVGVMAFSTPVARLEDQEHTLELRRMVLVPELPSNSASRALGMARRWLRSNDPRVFRLISYSDLDQGHEGTIYRASNWTEVPCRPGRPWNHRRLRRFEGARRKRKFEQLVRPREWERYREAM